MIRKNDTVIVIAGKEKGKTGKILSLFLKNGTALVEKLNRVKRHQRPTPKLRQGGMIEKEAPIHLSNLMLYCSKCSKGSRVVVKHPSPGEKTRNCHRCGEVFAS